MTAYYSLHSLLDYECLLLHCDWLGSDIRIGHFFSFRCPLISTPQLNTQLLNSLTTESESLTNSITRGEPATVRLSLLLFVVAWTCLPKRFPAMDYSACIHCRGSVLTEPLPSNGHIRHNMCTSLRYSTFSWGTKWITELSTLLCKLLWIFLLLKMILYLSILFHFYNTIHIKF
jgi:hypothetical protein